MTTLSFGWPMPKPSRPLPTVSALRSFASKLYQANAKFAEAETELRLAIRLSDANAEYNTGLGNLLLQSGDLGAAETALRRAIELGPASGDAHRDLEAVLRRQGRLEEAIVELRRAAELLPDDREIHFVLGQVLEKAGKKDEAVEETLLFQQRNLW